MPTADEIGELIDECTWESSTLNSVAGMTVTGPNGNSIFLPTAGWYTSPRNGTPKLDGVGTYGDYWSSTAGFTGQATILYFQQSGAFHRTNVADRRCSQPIRPVKPLRE